MCFNIRINTYTTTTIININDYDEQTWWGEGEDKYQS